MLQAVSISQPVMATLEREGFSNFVLMQAMEANTAGQIGSVMAGGVVLALLA